MPPDLAPVERPAGEADVLVTLALTPAEASEAAAALSFVLAGMRPAEGPTAEGITPPEYLARVRALDELRCQLAALAAP